MYHRILWCTGTIKGFASKAHLDGILTFWSPVTKEYTSAKFRDYVIVFTDETRNNQASRYINLSSDESTPQWEWECYITEFYSNGVMATSVVEPEDREKYVSAMDTIKRIKAVIKDYGETLRYDDGVNLLKIEEFTQKILLSKSERMITEEINKTGWPDDVILFMLKENGFPEDTKVSDFQSIERKMKFNPEDGVMTINIHPILKGVIQKINIVINKV